MNRFRRLQLARHLIEKEEVSEKHFLFNEKGSIGKFLLNDGIIDNAVEGGKPFITGGCESKNGEIGCNRPYGSYRPGEPFRDFPFQPVPEDIVKIKKESKLDEVRET